MKLKLCSYVAGMYDIWQGLLKVSKSWKQFLVFSEAFFLETPLPKKRTKYETKFCPMKLGQNFVKYFVLFCGNGVSRKNAF